MEARSSRTPPTISTAILFLFWLSTVGCSNKTTDSVFNDRAQQTAACANSSVKDRFLVQWEDGRITVHSAKDADEFVETFVQPRLEQIRHVEYDHRIQLFASDAPPAADPPTPTPVPKPTVPPPGPFDAPNGDTPNWGQVSVAAQQVWSQGFHGEGILVAVTDQGMDYKNPQISPRLAKNDKEFNGLPGVDDDGNGLIDDIYGWDFSTNQTTPTLGTTAEASHGTHVAGIIAADHDTGMIQGMAPRANIIPAAFLDKDGGGYTSNAIKALNYAAQRGARIVNASWGGHASAQ
jgi:subtilisin family serine protease